MLTDTHCHLDLDKFDGDRAEVLDRAWAAGLTRILIPGTDLASSKRAVALAASHPALYAAVGVHPTESLTWDPQTIPALSELATSLKVVAIGEIGLDYFWETAPHEHQQRVLREQLDLAAQLGLPVVLHMREQGDAEDGECAEHLLTILQGWIEALRAQDPDLASRPGVLHSFAGTRASAEAALGLGFCIGVTGPVTYKNAKTRQELIASLPLEQLLIETDAPFLAPHPHRGERNEPAYVCHIADKIAEIKSRRPEEIAAATTAAAERLFAWGGLG